MRDTWVEGLRNTLKMKVKVLKRNPQDYIRDRASDIQKVPRNLDPALHPLEGPREYTRALNAAKLERVFAKPFLGSLSGHTDGVYCMCKHPTRLSTMLSGSCDGVVKVWDLSKLECQGSCLAHTGFVRGVCVDSTGESFLSVGEDKNVKIWSLGELLVDVFSWTIILSVMIWRFSRVQQHLASMFMRRKMAE
jgi:WD repeat and SOF domain-containing protein 1